MANTLKCPSSGYSYDYGHNSKTGSGKTEKEANAAALAEFGPNEETAALESALKDANDNNSCEGTCKLSVDLGVMKYVQTGKRILGPNNVEVTVQSQVPVVLACAQRKVSAALFNAADLSPRGNLTEMVDKAFEEQPLREIADAPVFALQGVSEGDAELLQEAFNIKTVRDFANLKFFKFAQNIVARADSENLES
jgi:hypothetical protein